MKHTEVLVAALLLAGCGNTITEDGDDQAEDRASNTKEVAGSVEGQPAGKRVGGDYLQGYIVSSFDLTINDRHFSDSEDFYTQELERIEAEIADAGYEGYTVKLDALIGLDSMKHGMKVYVVSTGDQGFATDTKVNESGRFRVSVPAEAVNDTFKIRTNKRVNIVLTSPDKKTVVKFCYNFSGHETEASVAADALIRVFSTRITRYVCGSPSGDGFLIPPAKESGDASPPVDDQDSGTDAAASEGNG